ncbi:hypothetical protein FHS91_002603 [Sphingobium xanthum]|jgi:hypothetical protein|uniref:hypothetical protein n=1 Tax=Sphingobium xanthum TaxID=1387165 RepID=UPI001C8BA5F2|nr:hypothetical protein [Sphingobium xanthum]
MRSDPADPPPIDAEEVDLPRLALHVAELFRRVGLDARAERLLRRLEGGFGTTLKAFLASREQATQG